MLDGKLLARARERLARRRENNALELARREAEAYAKIPALRETDAALRGLVGELVSLTAAHGSASALEELGRRSVELCARKEALLRENGYPAGWLEEITVCPDCRDGGYRKDGSVCHCLRALYEEERAAELSFRMRRDPGRFEDFRLDYYTGEARECMELTVNTARAYAEGFGPASPNLLFQGGTGLGKTFLSACVADAVSARGFSVAYETAQGAFAAYEEQKFSRDPEAYGLASEKVKRILSCDLLILDDLGTELTTSFTQSALYNIVDTRLTAGKKTIVSTNLSDGELAARYLPQTVSRLSGEYDTLLFMGRDIRAIRKELRYR